MCQGLSLEERTQFNELVTTILTLKQMGAINSGFEIDANPETGLIRTRECLSIRESRSEIAQMLRMAHGQLLSVACAIAVLVDTRSSAWMGSPIDVLVHFLEKNIQSQIDALRMGEVATEPCNQMSVNYLLTGVDMLRKYVLNASLLGVSEASRITSLNVFAYSFLMQNIAYTTIKKISFFADTLLAVVQRCDLKGQDQAYVRHVKEAVRSKFLDSLREFFPGVLEAVPQKRA